MSYNTVSDKTFFFDGEDYHDANGGQRHDRVSQQKEDTDNMSSSGTGQDQITVTQRMVSATIGSVLTSLLVTPLDVVRVRLQSQNPQPQPPPINLTRFSAYGADFEKLPKDLGVKACCKEVFFVGDNGQFCLANNGAATTDAAAIAASDCAVEETQRKTINSTFDGLRKIARNEGPLTLWRGLTPTLVMAVPANVIYFTGYDWLRYNHRSPVRTISNDTYNPLISGSFARILAALAVSPIEMFRTRMQSAQGGATGVFKETMAGMRKMTQTQGYTSLWRGLTLTMWRDVPFSALYWWGYEDLRNRLRAMRNDGLANITTSAQGRFQAHHTGGSHMEIFVDSFLAGSISGAAAAFVTTPFDVGKTRQQVYRHAGDDAPLTVQAAKEAAKAGKLVPEELSMPRFLYHILKEEGASGLFKGWIPRTMKVAPACAIMISSYEMGKRWARTVNVQKEEGESQQQL
ncbi:Carrier protein, mitochondrial [Knufia fluminis]|uniref:Carrier protein, mitochondrial n=1 Tax=Knufia fluminis TaxID=191047 RepID=A0AAN8EZ42_9EURO|nr:Carrier protein, mitochondrial [Knufia fluminis]